LEDQLLTVVQQVAAKRRITVTGLVTQALSEWLLQQQAVQGKSGAELPTFSGNGLQPGVSLEDLEI
jgi:hypothetical protein